MIVKVSREHGSTRLSLTLSSTNQSPAKTDSTGLWQQRNSATVILHSRKLSQQNSCQSPALSCSMSILFALSLPVIVQWLQLKFS